MGLLLGTLPLVVALATRAFLRELLEVPLNFLFFCLEADDTLGIVDDYKPLFKN